MQKLFALILLMWCCTVIIVADNGDSLLVKNLAISNSTMQIPSIVDSISLELVKQLDSTEQLTEIKENPVVYTFSVSDSLQVIFSGGNLQCKPNERKWRFAEKQYYIVGTANTNCSVDFNGWIDLFAWSTLSTYYGISISTTSTDYKGDFIDWSSIMGEDWRTLNRDEWKYLLECRSNARMLYGLASVGGINGLVILPDNWSTPDEVTWRAMPINYDINVYSERKWLIMEAAGAVFLPASGFRSGVTANRININGNYWSSTPNGDYNANFFSFNSIETIMNSSTRSFGRAVRLIKERKL